MRRDSNSIKTLYEIPIPYFNSSFTKNFNFNTKVGSQTVTFYFKWDSNNLTWQSRAEFEDGSVRLIGVKPKVLNWSRFLDYSLYFEFDGQNIGLTDLGNCKIMFLEWML